MHCKMETKKQVQLLLPTILSSCCLEILRENNDLTGPGENCYLIYVVVQESLYTEQISSK